MRVFLCPNSRILRDLLNPLLTYRRHSQPRAANFACNSALALILLDEPVMGTPFAFNRQCRGVPRKDRAE
jgi:hypothetical protein